MLNIRVRKGKGVEYKLVNNATIKDKFLENVNQLKKMRDMFNNSNPKEDKNVVLSSYYYKLIYLYKDMLNIKNNNITCKDESFIDLYINKLHVLLINILSIRDNGFHLERIKTEYNIYGELIKALELLYNKIRLRNKKPDSIQSNKNIRGVFKPLDVHIHFNEIDECLNYTNSLSQIISNPDKELYHSITLFINIEQLKKYVFNNLVYYNNTHKPCSIDITKYNNFYNTHIDTYFMNQLFTIKNINNETTIHAITDYYNIYKLGIYVMIKNNRVAIFAPFTNSNKESNNNKLLVSPQKLMKGRKRDSDYNYPRDTNFLQIRDMFDQLCQNKIISDCEFIINPNKHISINTSLSQNKIPVFSFYSVSNVSAITIPTPTDWQLSTQLIYPVSFIDKDKKCSECIFDKDFNKNRINWNMKSDKLLFRGPASGYGYSIEKNNILKLAKIAKDENYVNLDVKLTAWNLRDKTTDQLLSFSECDKNIDLDVSANNRMDLTDYMKYKYIIYFSNSMSNYSKLLKLGSVIFKVESDSSCRTWLSDLTNPYIDHIPIKSDLSDLYEKLEWCKNNDNECIMIAHNAMQLYQKYITKGYMFDYLQLLCFRISERYETKISHSTYLELVYKTNSIEKLKHKINNLISSTNNKSKINLESLYKKLELLQDDINISYDCVRSVDTYDKNFDIDEIIDDKIKLDEQFIDLLVEYEKKTVEVINEVYTIIETL